MRLLAVLVMIAFSQGGLSQILPGMGRQDIHAHMADQYGNFVLREPPNADKLEFIKYEHVSGDKTLIVFFAEDGTCRFTRLIVDIFHIDDTVERFNADYRHTGENRWIAQRDDEEFLVSLEESEWIFTVTVRGNNEGQE
jgi:hypothetical protein